MAGPLEGIKVADFTHQAVGPWGVSLLAQMGADVIKIEPPEGDGIRYNPPPYKNGLTTTYQVMNLSKRATIILNLRDLRDQEIARKLVDHCDVLVENHRPGFLDRRSLGYDDVSKTNPGIIYVQSSGYGNRGPYRDMGSVDPYGQAISGFASTSGALGGLPEGLKQGSHIDLTTSQYITAAVTAALFAREMTGRGQKIELSQMEASIALGTAKAQEYFVSGQNVVPMGSAVQNIAPSEAFRAKDGKWINISAIDNSQWAALCRVLGQVELAKDPRFTSNAKRVENRIELSRTVAGIIAAKGSEEWLNVLEQHGVPCGPYLTYNQIRIDPQVKAWEMLVDVEGHWGRLAAGGLPWRFSMTPGYIARTPYPGHQLPEVLHELGYDPHASATPQTVRLLNQYGR